MRNQQFRVTNERMYGDGYVIRFAEFSSDGTHISIAGPTPLTTRERNSVVPIEEPPMLTVTRDALQSLMDELWAKGIRPQDIGTPGHLAATTKHLEDMRAIAFGKLEIQKPA